MEKYAGEDRVFVSGSRGPMAGDTLPRHSHEPAIASGSRSRPAWSAWWSAWPGFRFHNLGTTTQTAHALVTPQMTREALYVAFTRGGHRTSWYTATETPIDADGHDPTTQTCSATEVLTAVLARTGAEDSARFTIRDTLDHTGSLPTLVARYQHARTTAMTDLLREVATILPALERAKVLADPAALRLARRPTRVLNL